MRRLTVIAITVASTLAVSSSALYWWLESTWLVFAGPGQTLIFKAVGAEPNLYQQADGVMVLSEKQVAECEQGGGCAVYSRRELHRLIQSNILRPQGPNS